MLSGVYKVQVFGSRGEGEKSRAKATNREISRASTPFFGLFKGFLPVFLMESNSMCFSEFKNAIKNYIGPIFKGLEAK